jgi:hypothetical protein
MPDSVNLVKAELREINLDTGAEIDTSRRVSVQFNPESLKVSFANQIQPPTGSGTQNGNPPQQFVGAGTTKLALQLWFDVNAPHTGEINDVRKMTEKVTYFITPKEDPKGSKQFKPPGVRFIWGSFQFDGLLESLEESLEFFSSEGRPLRASVTLNLSQQKIDIYKFADTPSGNKKSPGANPLTTAPKGSTIQEIAANQGKIDLWKSIAAANGIENPRNLLPGQLIDMNALE